MAYGEVNRTRLHYVDVGHGEPVVLSHSYLVDHRQFEQQIRALSGSFRVLAFDHRDHGRSARALPGYDLDTLVDDTSALIAATGATPCHFVGLSTGGFIGARLAIRSPGILRSLTLMDTSGGAESFTGRLKYEAMLATLRTLGTRPVLHAAMRTMFSDQFLRDPQQRGEVEVWRERIAANDPGALTRFGRAIFGRTSVLDDLATVNTPTLVVVGENDRALPVPHAEALATTISGAELEVVPGAGHLCTIEQPEFVSSILKSFISRHSENAA